jgi:hypothetical protein
MVTGNDYSLISNKEFREFFPDFVEDLKRHDAQLIVEEIEIVEEESYEYLLANNKKAYDEYKLNGHTANKRGEGCFVLLAKRIDRLKYNVEVTTKMEDDVEEAIDPYSSVLLLRDTWSYTLILPASIEDSEYCQRIYDTTMNVLT